MKTALVSTLLFVCYTSFGQNLIESKLTARKDVRDDSDKVKIHLEASAAYLKLNRNEAKKYAQKALELSEKVSSSNLTIRSIQSLANAIRNTGDIHELFDLDTKAIEEAKKADNKLLLFISINAYANDLLAFNKISETLTQIGEMKSLGRLVNEDFYKARSLFTEGLYFFKLQKLKEAEKSFKESLELASKNNDQYLISLNKLRLFQTKVYTGVIDESAAQAFEAFNYFKENNYPEDMAYAQFLIGDSYRFQGNLEKAYQYYSDAYPVFVRLQNHLLASNVQTAFLQGYLMQQKMPLAKKSLDLLQNHYSTLNYLAGQGMLQNFRGQYYSANGEFSKADKSFEQSGAIAEKLNLQALKTINAIMISQHLERQKKTREADSASIKAYAEVQKSVSKELIENGYKTNGTKNNLNENQLNEKRLYLDSNFRKSKGLELLQTIRKKEDNTYVVSPYKPLLSIFDSSVTMAYNNQLLTVETKYKTRIIADSLRREQQNAIIAKQKIKNTNIIILSVAAISLLLLAGFALQYRHRLRAEKDREYIQMLQNEIHHRVKNNLGVINRLVEVAGKNAVDEVPLSSLKSRIKSIELIHTHLYSEGAKPGKIFLQTYLEDLCIAIAAAFQTGKDISIKIEASEELDSHVAEKLGLIINELVTNSYKYAFEGKDKGAIHITAQKGEKTIQIAVADNGIGFENAKTKSSYGMKLIKGLSHELDGKFSFTLSEGTRFQLEIPV